MRHTVGALFYFCGRKNGNGRRIDSSSSRYKSQKKRKSVSVGPTASHSTTKNRQRRIHTVQTTTAIGLPLSVGFAAIIVVVVVEARTTLLHLRSPNIQLFPLAFFLTFLSLVLADRSTALPPTCAVSPSLLYCMRVCQPLVRQHESVKISSSIRFLFEFVFFFSSVTVFELNCNSVYSLLDAVLN